MGKKSCLTPEFSWCLYDWANSAYVLTVAAAFFPLFFKEFWCESVDPTISTAWLGVGNSIGGLIVAFLSPFLGAIADIGRAKKRLLLLFVIIGCFSTSLLYAVPKGEWIAALFLFLIGSICFNSGNIFYDSLLTDVAEKNKMDWISSIGYSFGYIGGVILFCLNVLVVNNPKILRLSSPEQSIKISFMSVGIWWFIFSIPLFLFVHEKTQKKANTTVETVITSINSLKLTCSSILKSRKILFFLLSYWFYADGVHTFILMAADFGMSIGIEKGSILIALILVQLVAFPFSLIFGMLAKRFGAVKIIYLGLFIYIFICGSAALWLKTSKEYILLAGLSATAQGGIQALSRSLYGKMIPAELSAEYFGFYNVVSRFAVMLGPAFMALCVSLAKKAGLSGSIPSRIGVSSIALLFIVGFIFLFISQQIKEKEV
ncbi:MAG: MFS transporter [Chitinispirillaceae bacterium]|nr:MFS transporter [Chitinispirillaceae bacterium]